MQLQHKRLLEKDRNNQLALRDKQKMHYAAIGVENRREWNDLFDYNTNKEIKNEKSWHDMFQRKNATMDKRNQ